MNASFLDEGLSALIVQASLPEGFSRNADNVLLCIVAEPELGLDGKFPFTFHDLFHAGPAQMIPFPAESGLAHGFKGFVDEYASIETT
jgi:hypothetical protein